MGYKSAPYNNHEWHVIDCEFQTHSVHFQIATMFGGNPHDTIQSIKSI